MTHESRGAEVKRAIRFAGRVLLVVAGSIAVLLILRISFAFSRWAGYLVIGLIMTVIYATAHRWVMGLPGLLVLGVFNSLIGLITQHGPTNPHKAVSAGFAGLLLAFYTVGYIVFDYYDAAHFSAVDRIALLVYLFCMIWPAFTAGSNLGVVTPAIAWSMSIGMVALGVSFAIHRMRRRNREHGKVWLRILLIVAAVALISVLAAGYYFLWPRRGNTITEQWESNNGTVKIRVTSYAEEGGFFVPGMYYVFESAPVRMNNWHKITVIRQDDPMPIPRDRVRCVSDTVCYLFMQYDLAVTINGGEEWSTWNVIDQTPNWQANPMAIKNVEIRGDGHGRITLVPFHEGQSLQYLDTEDYGRHRRRVVPASPTAAPNPYSPGKR